MYQLPSWPADGLFTADNGKRGLAYRPGLEFAMWLHQPGWPVFYPDLTAADSLAGPAATLAQSWLTASLGLDANQVFIHFIYVLVNMFSSVDICPRRCGYQI